MKYPFDLTIIATGDSLRGFDFSKIPGEIWAINFASCYLPVMDRIVAGDGRMRDYPKNIPCHSFRKNGKPRFHEDHDVIWRRQGKKINRDPRFLGRINHTPFLAIDLAFKEGKKNIVILGCDQRGNRHFYDPPTHQENYRFDRYLPSFVIAAQCCMPDERLTFVETAMSIEGVDYLSMDQYKAILQKTQ